ncbi:hypothetical protein QEN71_42830 (plasmid) [Paraburkholderia sabiae]|nr:hypothetical protein [Paraburkholderia sabiae]WJZ79906.1 hypothetical protein QEN71_42830 [Paraburkholderia sabiae]
MSGRLDVMDLPVDLTTLSPDQLRALAAQLAVQLAVSADVKLTHPPR